MYSYARVRFVDVRMQLDELKEELDAARSRKSSSSSVAAAGVAQEDAADDDVTAQQREQIEALRKTVETLQTQINVSHLIPTQAVLKLIYTNE